MEAFYQDVLRFNYSQQILSPGLARFFTGRIFDACLSHGYFPTFDRMDARSMIEGVLLDPSEDVPFGALWTPHRVWHIRYDVTCLDLSHQAKRVQRKNRPFRVTVTDPFRLTPSLEVLARKYLVSCGFRSERLVQEVLPIWRGQSPYYDAVALEVFDGETPVSGGIFYRGLDSVASVFHFFDYTYARYSPGKYLILLTLEWMKAHGLRWYYPGYVVARNPRFDYKLFLGADQAAAFAPTEERYLDPAYRFDTDNPWIPFQEWMLRVPAFTDPLER